MTTRQTTLDTGRERPLDPATARGALPEARSTTAPSARIAPDETLACPACRTPLSGPGPAWSCSRCALAFPDDAGLPVLLPPGAAHIRDMQAHIHDDLSRLHNARKLPLYWQTGFRYVFNLLMAKHARMLARLHPRAGERHLDVGCQDGMILSQIVHRWGVRGTGVDVSEDSLRLALQRNDLGLRYYLADALSLPFREGSFDTVHSLGTMEHVPHPERFVAELARVARPGGRVLFDMINRHDGLTLHGVERWWAERRGRGAAARATSMGIGHDPATFLDPGEVRAMCKAAGLRVRRISVYNAFVPLWVDTRLPRILARLRGRKVDFVGRPLVPGPGKEGDAGGNGADPRGSPGREPGAGGTGPGAGGLAARRAGALALKGILPVAELLDLPFTALGYGNSFYVLAERPER